MVHGNPFAHQRRIDDLYIRRKKKKKRKGINQQSGLKNDENGHAPSQINALKLIRFPGPPAFFVLSFLHDPRTCNDAWLTRALCTNAGSGCLNWSNTWVAPRWSMLREIPGSFCSCDSGIIFCAVHLLCTAEAVFPNERNMSEEVARAQAYCTEIPALSGNQSSQSEWSSE